MALLRGNQVPHHQQMHGSTQEQQQRPQPQAQECPYINDIGILNYIPYARKYWYHIKTLPPKEREIYRFKHLFVFFLLLGIFLAIANLLFGNCSILDAIQFLVGVSISGVAFSALLCWVLYMGNHDGPLQQQQPKTLIEKTIHNIKLSTYFFFGLFVLDVVLGLFTGSSWSIDAIMDKGKTMCAYWMGSLVFFVIIWPWLSNMFHHSKKASEQFWDQRF